MPVPPSKKKFPATVTIASAGITETSPAAILPGNFYYYEDNIDQGTVMFVFTMLGIG
jgi:hypothetical protein